MTMKTKKTNKTSNDPSPYNGPIERADGTRPFNHYLWPTESWWAGRDLRSHQIHIRWNFGIVALADGRFSIEGCVYSIEKNEYSGKPCVFSTRIEAIRMAAARMIRIARASRNWESYGCGGLKGSSLATVINWARKVVAQETGKPTPEPIQIKEPPPVRRATGLPLFDYPT